MLTSEIKRRFSQCLFVMPLVYVLLALSCFQPRENRGVSDGCTGGVAYEKGLPGIVVNQVNEVPIALTAIDIPIKRQPGTSVGITLDLKIVTGMYWCGSSYSGPLSLSFVDLPNGVTYTLSPEVLPSAINYSERHSKVTINISPLIPDGPIPLKISAPEFKIDFQPYRLILSTNI